MWLGRRRLEAISSCSGQVKGLRRRKRRGHVRCLPPLHGDLCRVHTTRFHVDLQDATYTDATRDLHRFHRGSGAGALAGSATMQAMAPLFSDLKEGCKVRVQMLYIILSLFCWDH